MQKIFYISLISILSFSAFADDCKMFMVKKDRVKILEKKSCTVTVDKSNEVIFDVGVCLAKMTTSNNVDIMRVVVQGKTNKKYDSQELLIVEKRLDDISKEDDILSFSQKYFNPKDFNSSHFNVSLDSDLSSMRLRFSEGVFNISSKYDLEFHCE